MKPIFISKNELARRLGIALVTLDRRLDRTGTEPDAKLYHPGETPDGQLFDAANLPSLRATLLKQPQVEL